MRTPRIYLDRATRRGILDNKISLLILPPKPKAVPRVAGPMTVLDDTNEKAFTIVASSPELTTWFDAVPTGNIKQARKLGWKTSGDAQAAILERHDTTKQWEEWATGRRCWLLQIAVDRTQPNRWPAARPAADSTQLLTNDGRRRPVASGGDWSRGYVSDPGMAMDGEGPAVDDATLHQFAEAARVKQAAQLGQTLMVLREQLSGSRLDQRAIRVIEQQLTQIEKRNAA